MLSNSKRNIGFTLVEMSIVLVIIGLIVGGIMVGKDLIRSAELQATISDINKFTTAVVTFYGKYNCLPGDCMNATQFLGIAGGTGAADDSQVGSTSFGANDQTCNTALTSGAMGTCNGNGDEMLGDWNANHPIELEADRAWQHLALAGFIPGKYSGYSAAAPSNFSYDQPGINVPVGKFGSNSGYSFGYTGRIYNAGPWFLARKGGNFMTFGGCGATGNYAKCVYPAISAQDAKNIDTKIDDGLPGTGWIEGMPSLASGITPYLYTPYCLDSTNTVYNLSSTTTTGLDCALVIDLKI